MKGSVQASVPLALEPSFNPTMKVLGQDELPEWVEERNPRGIVVLVHGVLADTSYAIRTDDGIDHIYLTKDAVEAYCKSGIAVGAYADTLHNGQHSRIGKIIGQHLTTIETGGREVKPVLDFAVEVTDFTAMQNIPTGHYSGTSAAWTYEGVVGEDGLLRTISIGWDHMEGAISFVYEPQKADCSIYEIYTKGGV